MSRIAASTFAVLACLAGAAAAAPDEPPKPFNFSGGWTSDYGLMKVSQREAELKATYDHPTGRIIAKVKDRTADGYWLQSYSSRKCPKARNGTIYWGRITFTAAPDGAGFSGRYSYCDDAFDARDSGAWNGARK